MLALLLPLRFCLCNRLLLMSNGEGVYIWICIQVRTYTRDQLITSHQKPDIHINNIKSPMENICIMELLRKMKILSLASGELPLYFCFKNIFSASPSDLLLFRLFFEAHARAAFWNWYVFRRKSQRLLALCFQLVIGREGIKRRIYKRAFCKLIPYIFTCSGAVDVYKTVDGELGLNITRAAI